MAFSASVPTEDDGGGGVKEMPDSSWNNDRIRAYAQENGIDLTGTTTKAEMLARIEEYRA